jgi:hypothetical protein
VTGREAHPIQSACRPQYGAGGTYWKHEIAFASSLNSGRLIPSRSSSGLILLFFHFLTNRVTRLSRMTADNQLDRWQSEDDQLTFHTQDKWIGNRVPAVSSADDIRTYLVHKSKDSVSWGFGSMDTSRSNSLADTGSGIVLNQLASFSATHQFIDRQR